MIKKSLSFLLSAFLILSLTVSNAYADWYTATEGEWIRLYGRSKISKTVDVYSQTGEYVTTLSAGTYVRRTNTFNGECIIYWWENGSAKNGGYVPTSAVRTAVVGFIDDKGVSNGYQELKFFDMVESGEIDPSNYKFLYEYAYLNNTYNTPWATNKSEPTEAPAPEETKVPAETEAPGETTQPAATKKPSSSATKAPSTRKPSSSSPKTAAPCITATPAPVQATVMYQGMAAQIDVLSSYESEITVSGEKITVLTSELEFASSADEDERLAVIYAPRTGEATLRKSASQSAAMVKNCKGGRYALVLEKGRNFTRIYYNNAVGYIRTDCLKFYPIATEPWPEGVLSLNGYTNGQAEINIRNKADYGTHICGTYPTGTVVRVIETGKSWTEVEIDRIRGFIQSRFLTMTE